MERSCAEITGPLEKFSSWATKNQINHIYSGGHGCFDLMPEEQRVLAVTGLNRYMDFLESTETQEIDYANTVHLLTAAVEQLGLKFPRNVLDRILPTDYVEIYTLDLVPVFKSLNFWGNCSYSLDELYTYPYEELFGRAEFYQASLNRAAHKIFTGVSEFIENPVPEHLAWELRGPLKRLINYRFVSAAYGPDGELMGGIVVSKITPLSN